MAKSPSNRFLSIISGLGLSMTIADANLLTSHADQDKSKLFYESIGAIRELYTTSRLGLFEKKDESQINRIYPLNSSTNHLSVIRENNPKSLDQIIHENTVDPLSCPGIWPKEFTRTKKQLNNCLNNRENCLGYSQKISKFTSSDTIITVFGFLSGTDKKPKKPITTGKIILLR